MPGDTTTRTLIWDFDGTLGTREGHWTGAVLDVLEREAPTLRVTTEDIRPYLRAGFPWHTPEEPHTDIRNADQWWATLEPVFGAAIAGVGVPAAGAARMSGLVRQAYLAPERWRLYDDVVPTLSLLREQGWTHHILSNHVPELDEIVERLGLMPMIDAIHNSAEIGYEKPHPAAFQHALASVPGGAPVWMIGDSVRADVKGAQAAGIPVILVRKHSPEAELSCDTLTEVPRIVNHR